MTRFLHVANGTSTTATIHAAGLPGRSSIWADVLHDGPVPGGITDAALLEVRASYLARTYGGAEDESRAELQGWRAAIASGDPYDELVLWYEHDLFDQLNLIQVLGWIADLPQPPPRVSVISIDSFPGRPHFRGLGELTPSELASLFDTRRPVTAAQYALAGLAWQAFRSPNPRAVETLLAGDTTALPFLAAALRRHLEEFPWVGDGLSRTERRLLQLLEPGPLDLTAAFPRMHHLETAFYIADGSFLQVIDALASPPAALLTIEAPRGPEGPPPQGSPGRAAATEGLSGWAFAGWRRGDQPARPIGADRRRRSRARVGTGSLAGRRAPRRHSRDVAMGSRGWAPGVRLSPDVPITIGTRPRSPARHPGVRTP